LPKKIFTRLLSFNIAIILVVIVSLISLFNISFSSFYYSEKEEDLESKAILISNLLSVESDVENINFNELFNSLSTKTNTRFTIIDRQGIVLGDSHENPDSMDSHISRPEVINAFLGHTGTSIRFSNTINLEMLYLAIATTINDEQIVIRASVPTSSLQENLIELSIQILIAAIIILIIGFGASLFISRKIAQPLERMVRSAQLFARGDFTNRIRSSGISEINSLSKTLNAMAKQLDDDIRVRKEFVANVSHELKTPLTALKGYVETFKDIDNEEEKALLLDVLDKHTSRMNQIINDLLDLSKLEETDRSLIRKDNTNIFILLNNAINRCEYISSKKNIKLELSCNEDISFMVNEDLIEDAVVNLINNAVQYSNSNTTIKISSNISANELMIYVKDFGIGIKKNEIENIFKRFYCVDKSHSKMTGGTGLGLSIVKHIVNAHKGQIDVESQLGEGSTFTISIPK
tara:strand:- start:531 stop:1919 length:1389 start_codon:yes stop_codon:yes gene_type:complete